MIYAFIISNGSLLLDFFLLVHIQVILPSTRRPSSSARPACRCMLHGAYAVVTKTEKRKNTQKKLTRILEIGVRGPPGQQPERHWRSIKVPVSFNQEGLYKVLKLIHTHQGAGFIYQEGVQIIVRSKTGAMYVYYQSSNTTRAPH